MMKNVLPCLAIMIIVSACSSEKKMSLTIEGTLANGMHEKLILQELGINETITLDSVVLNSEGSFVLEIPDADTGFYLLRRETGSFVVLVSDGAPRMTLSGDWNVFPNNLEIKGSDDTRDLCRFYDQSAVNNLRADSLMDNLRRHVDSTDYFRINLTTDSALNAIWEDQRRLGMKFITDHPVSLASLIVINYSFGVRAVLSVEEDLEVYGMLADSLATKYPFNRHVIHFVKLTDDYKRRSLKLAP